MVRAIVEEEIEHASVKGTAYSWDSTELDIAADGTMLYLKNNSDTTLILDRVTINGSNVICFWTILIGALITTPSGGTVTGVNLNEVFSTKQADVTAISNETAVADGSIIDRIKTPIDNSIQHNLQGIILGKDHYIQINQITESDSGSVVVFGHFESPS